MKSIASIVSLGSGFRGGLFFASLLLGALGGQLFAAAINWLWPTLALDAHAYAIIGMGALSVSVIGGPLTMTFIALETTGDLWLTTAVLIAVIISAQVTRRRSAIRSRPGASICAARPSAARPMSAGSAISRSAA